VKAAADARAGQLLMAWGVAIGEDSVGSFVPGAKGHLSDLGFFSISPPPLTARWQNSPNRFSVEWEIRRPVGNIELNPRAADEVPSVVVFFATDRALESKTGSFGPTRARSTTLGSVVVSIPPNHKLGEIERPRWYRRLIYPTLDASFYMIATLPRTMSSSEFYHAISLASDSTSRSAFIFVHGYNNSFEDAALRTAQMAVDLQLPTVPVFYSWPSQSKKLD
jgi:esterase/lipase superfamily enzyme